LRVLNKYKKLRRQANLKLGEPSFEPFAVRIDNRVFVACQEHIASIVYSLRDVFGISSNRNRCKKHTEFRHAPSSRIAEYLYSERERTMARNAEVAERTTRPAA
jgi:hypothetical protein